MLVAVLDSATPAVTAALADVPGPAEARAPAEGRGPETRGLAEERGPTVALRAVRTTVDARGHGELLAAALADLLREAGVKPRDLAAVVAGTGPGPFTGLRVGLVTAAALGDALGIPTYGVCSLDAIGHATSGVTLVATDARRREIYWAVYADGTPRTGPAVDRPADVAGRLTGHGVERAVGEGAQMYADVLAVPVADQPRYPPPLALAVLAADRVRTGAPTEQLSPLYLRRPDAVEPAARKPAARKAMRQ